MVLPTFLFTSHSLVTLKLDIYDDYYHYDMKVPCKVCLPNLKSLHLKNIRFVDGDSIHRLISGCLALEDLDMYLPELPNNINKFNIHSLSLKRLALDFLSLMNDFPYTFVINAPNLVYFKYHGPLAKGYCLSNMNSLGEADVEVYQLGLQQPSYDVNLESGVTATISNLLQGICNVKSLRLALDWPETLIRMPPEPVLGFHKLVELKIHNKDPFLQGTWVIQFLRCAPNLQTLHLDMEIPDEELEPLPLPKEVPSCLLSQLKEIKIVYFDGNEHMFEMISYFLNHASVLEELIIGIEKEELSIVQRFPRNSKKCRVVILEYV